MKTSKIGRVASLWKLLAGLMAIALLASACGGADTSAEQAQLDELQEQLDELTEETQDEPDAVDETTTTSTTTTAAPTTTTTIDPCLAPGPTTVTQSPPEAVSPAGTLTSPTASAVLASGSISVGVTSRDDAVTAFESLLVDEIVARMFGDVTIERVPLGVVDRFERLPDVDFMFRNTTATTSRAEFGLFTRPYMVEGLTIVSRVGESFDLTCFSGTIAVLAGTTTAIEAEEILEALSSESFEIVEAADTGALLTLLDSGAVDLATLFPVSYLENAGGYDVVASGVIEPINGWVFDDVVFRDELDAELARIVADGTWETFYVDTFGEEPFFDIAKMRAAPTPDR